MCENENINTFVFMIVELVVLVAYTNNLYLAFPGLRIEDCPAECKPQNSSSSLCENCTEEDFSAPNRHELHVNVVFFLGLTAGSVLAGAYASWKEPVSAVKFQSALIAVAGLLLSHSQHQDISVQLFLWFIIAACSLGTFAVEYVYIMECIRPRWRMAAGLLGMGLQWTCSRFYGWLINERIGFWTGMYCNSLAVIVGSYLVDVCRVPRKKENVDEFDEDLWKKLFYRNKFGSRNLYILISLWFLHGYVYFGLARGWAHIADENNTEDHLNLIHHLVNLADAFAKIMTFNLCLWSKKHNAVFIVIVLFNGLICLLMSVLTGIENIEVIKYVGHVSSFLISASFSMAWLGTTEIFPNKIRYLAVGLCCCFARLGAILGVCLATGSADSATAEPSVFYQYPAAIAGVFLIIATVLGLWLPETFREPLAKKFRATTETVKQN